jgi:hypothetical protein
MELWVSCFIKDFTTKLAATLELNAFETKLRQSLGPRPPELWIAD